MSGIDEEPDGEHLHAVLLDGFNERSSADFNGVRPAVLHPEHLGHRGSVYICVKESYAVPGFGERHGEVGGDGRFAYSALTAVNSDDVLGVHTTRLFLPFF